MPAEHRLQRAILKNRELAKQRVEAEREAVERRRSNSPTAEASAFGLAAMPPPERDDDAGQRILIYSHSLPPWVDGVSTRFKSHIKMLKEQGHHVHLFTIEENIDPAVRACAESCTFLESTCLHWYPAKRFPNLTLRNLRAVWAACAESRADVIHCTMCPSLPLFAFCARVLGLPLMVSIHTDSVTLLDKCAQPWWTVRAVEVLEPLGSWFADGTYTVSPSYSAILLQRGITCLPVTWGGFCNPATFHPDAGLSEREALRTALTFGKPHEFILLTAGRVSPEKDIGFLVGLVRRFRAQGFGVWLAIIGDGPAAAEFSPLHGDPAAGVWFMPGFKKQAELAALYAAVDVVASASTFETFGYTAIEAMCCGTPFLGPRAQGFRDTVKHGRGGYLFDAKDETSAAHYLEILLHEKAELFPPSVVLAAVADFTADACLKRTLAAYQATRHKKAARMGRAVDAYPGSGAALRRALQLGSDSSEAAKPSGGPGGGGGGGGALVRQAICQCLQLLPALVLVASMFVNWAILNYPRFAAWARVAYGRLRRTAGAQWQRRMRFTNLTRNRMLVGTQVTK